MRVIPQSERHVMPRAKSGKPIRQYIGDILPQRGVFPGEMFVSVLRETKCLRPTKHAWFVLELDEVVVIRDSDVAGLAEVMKGKRVVGAIFLSMARDRIAISGESDSMLEIVNLLTDAFGGRFKKNRVRCGIDFSDPATLMQIAIADSDMKSARSLLRSGLDPNGTYPHDPCREPDEEDEYGQSFLTTAATLNDAAFCELLVHAGASTNEVLGEAKFPPLLVAAKNGAKQAYDQLKVCTERRFHSAASRLLKDSKLNEQQRELLSHLEFFVLVDFANGVKELKKLDPELSQLGKPEQVFGRLLHMACSAANRKVVRYLLDNGANTEVVNEFGATPLFECCDRDVCKLMVEAGAKPNAKNCWNETPLMVIDWAQTMLVLLEHGGKANARNLDGNGMVLLTARSLHRRWQRDPKLFRKHRKSEDGAYAEVLERLIQGKSKIKDELRGEGTTARTMLEEIGFQKSIQHLDDA